MLTDLEFHSLDQGENSKASMYVAQPSEFEIFAFLEVFTFAGKERKSPMA